MDAWDVVQIARHKDRPNLRYYLDNIFRDFYELHGDRCYGDDKVIIGGFARIGTGKSKKHAMIVGHNKEKNVKKMDEANYGMAKPEGYGKALRLMELAEKYHLPVLSFIDTPGADPSVYSEERGIARAIANNLFEMSRLRTPIIVSVIGEGGSGGALGIGVGDRILMQRYSYYSVISPEGCSSILWKDYDKNEERKKEAAESLKLRAEDLYKLGIIDEIVSEAVVRTEEIIGDKKVIKKVDEGAHINPERAAQNLEEAIEKNLNILKKKRISTLMNQRYKKWRNMASFFSSDSDDWNH